MLLERLYEPSLAQASYLVGCQATGEAVVVDPTRNVERYLRAATDAGLRITHVTETHIHADFVSGSRQLAARTGARLLLSGEGGTDWQYDFAAADGATLLRDGDHFMVGNVKLSARHTPGHTPEHLTFLVTDTPASMHPMGALTGDFIFAGDVGRPDLLEKAAHVAGSMVSSARTLHRSLQRFARLPDYLQLFPGHGAGSACGKALGAVPSTTLGYEKIANWALAIEHEDDFVVAVLEGQPEAPAYFAEMKRINKQGPPLLASAPRTPHLEPQTLTALLARGEYVVDTRSAAQFALAHVPGTINIPLDKRFVTWAGSLLDYSRSIFLIVSADCERCGSDAVHALSLIGLDRVGGVFSGDPIAAYASVGGVPEIIPQLTAGDLAGRIEAGPVSVVDVRDDAEWAAGHVVSAIHLPLSHIDAALDAQLQRIPRGAPIVVHCQSGARSAIAVSLLRARGIRNVSNLAGGYAAWVSAGLPTTTAGEAV
jgi:hydroxyacylglutathione hydrolase